MKAPEDWKSKVASLKRYAEDSLKQLEEDKEYLMKQLKDLEDSIETLNRLASLSSMGMMKYSDLEPGTSNQLARRTIKLKIVKGEPIDLPGKLIEQKAKIPTYRSMINRFAEIGMLLQTSLKRLSEAEALIP